MGPIQNLLGMLPGLPKEMRNASVDDAELGRVEAIISSMTAEERRDPAVINGSRRARIARGSGTSTQQVNGVLKQFKMANQLMRSMTRPGKRGKRRGGFPDLAGLGLPGTGLPGGGGLPGGQPRPGRPRT
jgi:signal recognition particle subunit SRP54